MKKYRFPVFFFSFVMALCLCAGVSPRAAALEDPAPRHCRAAVLVDGDYGDVVYSYHADEKMYPASITKVMTSLLVMEALSEGPLTLQTPVTVSQTAATLPEGSSTAGIKAGEVLTVEELLYCDLLVSANEACNILAEAVAGSIPAFVEMMNAKAQELGMKNTHFMNPHGLHDEQHYTTAYDITIMCRAAMEYETFRTIVATAKHTVPATNLSEERVLHNTNYLLRNPIKPYYTYNNAIGIKTGSTTPAGQCLASAATDADGRTFYCVVLGAETAEDDDGLRVRFSFVESRRLLEWAFDNFQRMTLLDDTFTSAIREVGVTLSDEGDYVNVQPSGRLEATVPNDFDPALVELRMDLPESVEAPVEQGEKLGSVSLYYDGKLYGTLDMAASFSVPRSDFQYYLREAKAFLDQWWVKAAIAGGLLLIVLLVVLFAVILPRRRRRRRYSRSGSRSGARSSNQNYKG